MRALDFWCPTCKVKKTYLFEGGVVPTTLACADCFSQVFRRGEVYNIEGDSDVKKEDNNSHRRDGVAGSRHDKAYLPEI